MTGRYVVGRHWSAWAVYDQAFTRSDPISVHLDRDEADRVCAAMNQPKPKPAQPSLFDKDNAA